MSKLLTSFKKFYTDRDGWEMFITGPAGTGKTTSIRQIVDYCHEQEIDYTVCAFTHKACGVLASKLPENANIKTLHSFLCKRPTINSNAKKVDHIEVSTKHSESDETSLLIIDEFSMVGEEDLMDIRALQDEDYDGIVSTKVVWVGDMNQLPPIKDAQTVNPFGDYWFKLTKVHRQKDGNPLLDTLSKLVAMIEGGTVEPLVAHKTFLKECPSFEKRFLNDDSDKVMLCYTNQAVQFWNQLLMDRDTPVAGDLLFSPTAHRYFQFVDTVSPSDISYVDRIYDDPLAFNSKYKTLEFLLASEMCSFFRIVEDGDDYIYPVIFGTYNYKLKKEELGREATAVNREIESTYGHAATWAKANYTHKLARKRAEAWRKYLTFKDCVLCMDFPYAMTVHKSQGSTFKNVYLDAQDLYKCADRNMNMYLRLYYVALSRAQNTVITN